MVMQLLEFIQNTVKKAHTKNYPREKGGTLGGTLQKFIIFK